MRPARVLLALTALLLPAVAEGQQVEGRVVDDETGLPVPGAVVGLADSTGRVLRSGLTGESGRFWLSNPEAGPFTLSIYRLGYATVTGEPVELVDQEVVEVEVHMRPEAVPVEPLRVVTRRHIERFTVDEFYDRMNRLSDRGAFMTAERIKETRAISPSWAISWMPGAWRGAGVELVSYGKLCKPAIYVDGRLLPSWALLDDWVMVDRIEGIELYRGNFSPGTYGRDPESWGCGMILVWTKTDPDPRFAFTWGRTALFAVLGAVVMSLRFVI